MVNLTMIYSRFHSDEYQYLRKGFLISYEAMQLFTACGGNYSNASGVLASPSHPNAHPEIASCVYLISQPNGAYVNISFLSMDVDCKGTQSGYIEMRDGNSEDSPFIAKYCGNSRDFPASMQTTQNHLRIR